MTKRLGLKPKYMHTQNPITPRRQTEDIKNGLCCKESAAAALLKHTLFTLFAKRTCSPTSEALENTWGLNSADITTWNSCDKRGPRNPGGEATRRHRWRRWIFLSFLKRGAWCLNSVQLPLSHCGPRGQGSRAERRRSLGAPAALAGHQPHLGAVRLTDAQTLARKHSDSAGLGWGPDTTFLFD